MAGSDDLSEEDDASARAEKIENLVKSVNVAESCVYWLNE